jgi:pyridoxal phosphate enzyme (YggS family)
MDAEAGDSIENRIAFVLNQIRVATRKAGRADGSVRLVGATKSVAVGDIRRAAGAGLTLAGENRLQEALPKIEALKDTGVIWHFIGRLQRRKVRSVVGIFDLIHSVDSLELAREIDRRAKAAGLRQKILLEVNIAEESSKAGFLGDQVEGVLPQLAALDHVAVCGLMAIPPLMSEPERARRYFRALRDLATRFMEHEITRISMDELSMGMSHDYEIAIEEGATLVRLGTGLFGKRRG